jgi:hypothetical protein
LRVAVPRSSNSSPDPANEILDRARDENLTRVGPSGDPRTDVHGDAGDPVVSELDLAGVEPRPDLEIQRSHRRNNRLSAADGPSRAVERCEEAIAGRIHLTAVEPLQLAPDSRVMLLDEVPPATIPELRGSGGGADEIREEHSRQHTRGAPRLPRSCQELSNLGDGRLGIEPGHVIVRGKLDISRARDRSREISRVLDVTHLIPCCVDDERRHADRGHDVADVDVERHAHERLGRVRRRRVGHHFRPPVTRPFLAGDAWRDRIDPGARPEPLRECRHPLLELLLCAFAPGPLVVCAFADLRALKDERDRAFRVGRGEEHRERAALGLAHHRRTLASDRVHDRPDVVHALLERRRAWHAVRHSHPTLVEEAQPRELGEPLAVAPELRELPVDLEMRQGTLDVDEVDRPVADDAIGDVDVAAACEAHVGHGLEHRADPSSWTRAASRRSHRRPNECGRGSDSQTVSSCATRRASGPRDSSDETRTFRFSPTRS